MHYILHFVLVFCSLAPFKKQKKNIYNLLLIIINSRFSLFLPTVLCVKKNKAVTSKPQYTIDIAYVLKFDLETYSPRGCTLILSTSGKLFNKSIYFSVLFTAFHFTKL